MKKAVLFVFVVSFAFFQCTTGRMSVSTAKSGKGDSYLSYLSRGTQLLEQKRYDDAINELRQASALKPDSDRAFNFLGIAYFMKKNFPEALTCFQKAMAINPAYAAAVCNLGNLQFEMGEIDTALATLSKAVVAFKDNISLHFNLGTILLHKGEIEQGFAHLQKVMELDPGYLDREKRFSFQSSESSPPQPELLFRYACLYASTGNLEKTLDYMDKAKKKGFVEWQRILHNDAFAPLRDDPHVMEYLE